jgi:hypothetical protein
MMVVWCVGKTNSNVVCQGKSARCHSVMIAMAAMAQSPTNLLLTEFLFVCASLMLPTTGCPASFLECSFSALGFQSQSPNDAPL